MRYHGVQQYKEQESGDKRQRKSDSRDKGSSQRIGSRCVEEALGSGRQEKRPQQQRQQHEVEQQ